MSRTLGPKGPIDESTPLHPDVDLVVEWMNGTTTGTEHGDALQLLDAMRAAGMLREDTR